MPGEDLARRILAEFPHTRIVAITSAQGHMQARRALDAGVRGYLSKAASNSELIRAIRRVQAGGRMIPGPVASRIAEHLTEETLTSREIQVLQLVARGNRNKEVAAQLSIAEETVRMHMKNILGKLAANDRTHAVTIAVTRGMLRLWDAIGAGGNTISSMLSPHASTTASKTAAKRCRALTSLACTRFG